MHLPNYLLRSTSAFPSGLSDSLPFSAVLLPTSTVVRGLYYISRYSSPSYSILHAYRRYFVTI